MRWNRLTNVTQSIALIGVGILASGCDLVGHLEKKAESINRYEVVALHLAQENDKLKTRLGELEAEVETLKSKNSFLALQVGGGNNLRSPASVAPVVPDNDMVNQKTYHWQPDQLVSMAQKEFSNKNYEKSAQYFKTMLTVYPSHKELNDAIMFQSAVAAYESGKHDDWVVQDLSMLIEKFPTSPYYRGAKLWRAMAHLRMGKEQDFFNTVDEFRKKYRNTTEWEILSAHYEKMLQKYKK